MRPVVLIPGDDMSAQRHSGILLLLLAATLSAGCATMSFDQPKSYSEAIADTADTALGRAADGWSAQHDGLSGFFPLNAGMDALGVRLKLAEQAEKSLDLQYFLMKNDTAGRVMMNALLKAGDLIDGEHYRSSTTQVSVRLGQLMRF